MANANGIVLADDATGALECASLLAGLHLKVSIAITGAPGEVHGVQVADTESRHLSPEQAAHRVRQWLINAPPHVFKKTDSTLRGNIAAELLAMLDIARAQQIVYVPAYPALGRTVIGGQLFVHGTPVADTEFAFDARHSVRTSRIASLFPASTTPIPNAAALANALHERTPGILICDAATNEDFNQLAVALHDSPTRPWLAGPAGFIAAWAGLHPFPKATLPATPQPRKWLVVCGSRHPQSRRQSDIAAALGLQVIRPAQETNEFPELVAAGLAREACEHIQTKNADALLIMGGDTVWAIWRALGITTLTPLPEILPGVAASLSPEQNLLFVTKAGGFGDDRLVETVLESCNRT